MLLEVKRCNKNKWAHPIKKSKNCIFTIQAKTNCMKQCKKLFPLIFLIITFCASVLLVSAQQSGTAKKLAITNLVDSQQYVFYAESVIPMSGRQKFLTSSYTVYISKDTVISDLPFFGRAYSAPINAADGGIKFTSINFDYTSSARKKGGWNITIKPKDVPDVQQLSFTIYTNGTAYLNVNSTNRQSISFNGHVAKNK